MRNKAFTLLEMVIVMTIIILLSVLALPAYNTIMNTRDVTQAADLITGQLSFARQQAVAQSSKIEFRLLRYTDPNLPGDAAGGAYHAMQIFEINSQSIAQPVSKVVTLPNSIVMESGTTFSSLLSGTQYTTTTPIPKVGTNYKYQSFIFNSDGSTDLSPSSLWFVTVHNANKQPTGTSPPADFATIVLDPLNGTVQTFRP